MLILALLLAGQCCPPPPHLMPLHPFILPGPAVVRPAEEPVMNFGLGTATIRSGPRYRRSGLIVGRDEALSALPPAPAAIQGGTVPDRSRQGWLTVWGGSDAERRAVLEKLPPDTAKGWKVNDYPAGHWALRPGFPAPKDGRPVLMLQRPDAAVDHFQADGSVGEALVAALREPSKDNDPSKYPDRRRGGSGGGDGKTAAVGIGLLVASALAGAMFRKS